MKKRMVVILMATVMFIMGGCKGETLNENNTSNTQMNLESIAPEEIETVSKGQAFLRELDFEYVSGTDSQCNEGQYVKTAYAPTGTYTLENNLIKTVYDAYVSELFLYFTDDATGAKVPLCVKGNCTHDNEDCNAYFGHSSAYEGSTLHYYDNNIYVVEQLEDYYTLVKMSPDGSSRERVCNIIRRYVEITYNDDGSVTTDGSGYPDFVIHRGYVYYDTYMPGCTTASLNRVKIEKDAEIETIFTLESEEEQTTWLYRVKPYGRYVFFQMGYETNGELDVSIYAYDTEKLDIFEVVPDIMRDFIIVDNHIIYEDSNDEYHVMDFKTGEERSVFNPGITTYTDEYFNVGDLIVLEWNEDVFDEETQTEKNIVYQVVYNLDGKLVSKLNNTKDKLYEPY